ncbi:FAD-dependent thymidylate synthase [Bradyrhizobium genomosp. III]|uniref:FAD-dependent thymidylate synthase n=1 Tax=Bradyrhizobium genomosp. III TaxID=2683271 RepID=UPI000576DC7C|nr:FAD-dependent thymidylate synthase [Bradyrhizobium sp. CCBAU 15635]
MVNKGTKPGSATRRPTVQALEKLLHEPIKVLDHGFIRVVDYMGDDEAIVDAARVSYGRGTKTASEDRALIHYLMRHQHTTPFEMAEIKFHIKLPIFVARQWIRHRTASVNEYSARYSILDREFYLPTEGQLATQSEENRQGRGKPLSATESAQVLNILRQDAERNYEHYEWMLNVHPHDEDRTGIARELARINLTLNTYTQWYWKIDLHNLLHFLRLRADRHAQSEIREYANQMLKVVEAWVPQTYEAFLEHRLGAISLSRTAIHVVRRMIEGDQVTQADSGLSEREWRDLLAGLAITPKYGR